jgi:hypothetical protein
VSWHSFPHCSALELRRRLKGALPYEFEFSGREYRLILRSGRYVCLDERGPVDESVEVESEFTVPGYVKITGLAGVSRFQCLYLGASMSESLSARVGPRWLGRENDVFATREAHVAWLELATRDLREELTPAPPADPLEALELLYRSKGFFGGQPVGGCSEYLFQGKRVLVQALTPGSLDWARGGPFAVASEIEPGRWVAQQLTYGFARTFSMPPHRELLGPPVTREIACDGTENAVHPYPGSYQVFEGAILHWDKETNRVWYQTWDGELREK